MYGFSSTLGVSGKGTFVIDTSDIVLIGAFPAVFELFSALQNFTIVKAAVFVNL
jgi:hypothetical protein